MTHNLLPLNELSRSDHVGWVNPKPNRELELESGRRVRPHKRPMGVHLWNPDLFRTDNRARESGTFAFLHTFAAAHLSP